MKKYVIGSDVSVLYVNEIDLCEVDVLVIPKSVCEIKGNFAFYTSLKCVYYEGSLVDWCMIEFESMYSNPATVDSLVYIDNELIERLVIPNCIKRLKKYTFDGFLSVKEVVIGSNLEFIPNKSFNGCLNLEKFVCESSTHFESYLDCLYSKDLKVLYKYPANKKDDTFMVDDCLVLPYAFAEVRNLKKVFISNVHKINPYSFAYAKSIETIEMSDDVEEICEGAFYIMDNLVDVRLSENLKIIDTFGFMCCSNLENIYLPESISKLEKCAFKHNPKLKIHFVYERLWIEHDPSWNHDNSEIIYKHPRRK